MKTCNHIFRNLQAFYWFIGWRRRELMRYLKERYEHFKFCFTKITPSEDNIYNRESMYTFQCNEVTCCEIFKARESDTKCPHCGSTGFIPISGVKKAIRYNEDEMIFEEVNLRPVIRKI